MSFSNYVWSNINIQRKRFLITFTLSDIVLLDSFMSDYMFRSPLLKRILIKKNLVNKVGNLSFIEVFLV